MIQLTKSGLSFTSSDEIEDLREEFARDQSVLLKQFLPVDFLEMVQQQTVRTVAAS